MTYEEWTIEVISRRRRGHTATQIAQWNQQQGLTFYGTLQIRSVLRAAGLLDSDHTLRARGDHSTS
jgi:hypothetical protein